MGDVIIKPVDWFASQPRDEVPATRHDGEVIRIDADPTWMHRRALGLQVARAKRTPRGFDPASPHWAGPHDPPSAA